MSKIKTWISIWWKRSKTADFYMGFLAIGTLGALVISLFTANVLLMMLAAIPSGIIGSIFFCNSSERLQRLNKEDVVDMIDLPPEFLSNMATLGESFVVRRYGFKRFEFIRVDKHKKNTCLLM